MPRVRTLPGTIPARHQRKLGDGHCGGKRTRLGIVDGAGNVAAAQHREAMRIQPAHRSPTGRRATESKARAEVGALGVRYHRQSRADIGPGWDDRVAPRFVSVTSQYW